MVSLSAKAEIESVVRNMLGVGTIPPDGTNPLMTPHGLTGTYHTVSGLTPDQVLTALTSSTFGWRELTLPTGVAGAGLTLAGNILAVGAGLGITVNADDVALTTPGTLSTSSTNASAGSHTHAITTTNAGAASTVMATDASGGFTFADGAEFGFSDAGIVRPVANGLAPASGDHFQSTSFVSGVSGWRITDDGKAEFQDGYFRGSLHASVFVKDMIEAHAGSMVIGKSAGKLSRDMTVPVAGTWTMYLEDPPGGGFLFANSDIVRVKTEYASGLLDLWFVVSAQADAGGGEQSYTCTWSSGDRAVERVYPKGSVAVDYGVSGQGYLYMSADAATAPYYDVRTHAGAPWTTETLRLRLGNLNGTYGVGANNYFGIGIGDATAASDYFAYDPTSGIRMKLNGGEIQFGPYGISLSAGHAVWDYGYSLNFMDGTTKRGSLYATVPSANNDWVILECDPADAHTATAIVRATAASAAAVLSAAGGGTGAAVTCYDNASASYVEITGHLEVGSGKYIGLGSAAGRIVFFDAATDEVAVVGANFSVPSGNAIGLEGYGGDSFIKYNSGIPGLEFYVGGTRRGYIDATGWHNG